MKQEVCVGGGGGKEGVRGLGGGAGGWDGEREGRPRSGGVGVRHFRVDI